MVEDAFNFYLSQLRVTIERAFGVLVQRWAILRSPLTIPLFKVAPLMYTLCVLHNFCINENLKAREESSKIYGNLEKDARHLSKNVARSNVQEGRMGTGTEQRVVGISTDGCPNDLLGAGEHFDEVPRNRFDIENTPMDEMIKFVERQGLLRPLVRDRT